MKSLNEIRNSFIDFFVKNGHSFVKASPLIPHNDPSLMFVNSGMVQFKNVFTGLEKRPYTKATSSQKSIRAGGKHNDLDNVGYTARHHTFFEMLGNFSFGDYFKEEAIYYAWTLLTKEFGIDKNKLYATVYHTDDEAYNYWKKIAGFGDDRIIRIKTNDNFWSMGDTGPCGPCSEIFYDHGDHIPGGLPGTPEEDGDRFIEIWNMVFMQYEQIDAATRIELPQKSIDTGMGLERISAVLQNVHDNYDIDLFKNLISNSQELTKTKAAGEQKFSHRVIADHLRSSAFLIADGVMPSNEGRGYVLRRIMRRAMRHAHLLGAKEPLLYKLLPCLVAQMSSAYPELAQAEEFISGILKQEEERFKTTLSKGLKLLEDASGSIANGGTLPGETVFKLYDTYGFPVDLTEDILKSRQIQVDHAGFEAHMLEQKNKARAAWSGSGEQKFDKIWFDVYDKLGATEFLGYKLEQAEATIGALVQNGQMLTDLTNPAENFVIITNQTPFYGESGGQMGDVGAIAGANFTAEVIDTKKYLGKLHAHICRLTHGSIKVGDNVVLTVNGVYRNNLRRHHSATHILHKALRDILGTHVTQKGSLVAHDRLRFDISHPSAIAKDDLTKIENIVNQIIAANSEVHTVLMPVEDAIAEGAMALFGEKYDDEVRVVSMGTCLHSGRHFSVELCGGTHVRRTGDIGTFKITSESAIAAGVRRIEAVVGQFALDVLHAEENLLASLRDVLKTHNDELVGKVENLLSEKKVLEKKLSDLILESLVYDQTKFSAKAKTISNAKVLYHFGKEIDPKIMRLAAEQTARSYPDSIAIYVAHNQQKLSIVVGCGESSRVTIPAVSIMNKIAEFLSSNPGGGNDFVAQGGALYSPKIHELEAALTNMLA